MNGPRSTWPNETPQRRDSEADEDIVPEEHRLQIVAILNQAIESGTLPKRWKKRFEKELRAFQSTRSSP